ncbi:hypothetical protein JCM33374_g4594 [Metschnikowia sp. JCM 33374]|nr:hypothetical protein JCM33374_g4594 [Metschnikowia sp. JCM 33374]
MSAETPIDAGTKDWFSKKFGVLDDTALAKLLSIKSLYHLSNDDVYVKWESFVVTQQHGDLDPSTSNVEKFQQYLQDSIAASNQKKTPALKKVRDLAGAKRKPMMDFSSSPGVLLPSTPQLKRRKPVLTSEPDSSPSREAILSSPRKQSADSESNTIVETLNPHIDVAHTVDSVSVGADFESKKFNFRTMAMKLLESADVLDEQIDSASSQLSDLFKGSDISLSNPCMSSQFDIVCCGRIVPDSPFYDPSHQQALNDKSLYLETSRLGGIGQRIPLDVSQLSEYSFFPGQVVGLKGRNPTGRTFVVHEVLEMPQLKVRSSTLDEIQEYRASEGEGSKVFIAAGPFSNQHTLNFDKLASLVNLLNTEIKPQVAIFFGPFLDLTNKVVESGDLEFEGIPQNQQPKNLDEVFKLKITPILKKIDPKIKVIILPSLKDSASKHTSFPQAPFERRSLGLPKDFNFYPNPCRFLVDDADFAASNMDVFRDLKDVFKQSFSENSKVSSNRFERIAHHIFDQKRFYPMFPGSVKKTIISKEESEAISTIKDGIMGEDLADIAIGGSSLEVPYMGLAEFGDPCPAVMVIPSEMKYFAKVVGGVVVINPGQFIRPSRDASREEGSYVVLSIKAADDTDTDNIEKIEDSDQSNSTKPHTQRRRNYLTKKAFDYIVGTYSGSRNGDPAENNKRTAPVAARTWETLIRLSTAHAKVRLSKTIDVKDATVAETVEEEEESESEAEAEAEAENDAEVQVASENVRETVRTRVIQPASPGQDTETIPVVATPQRADPQPAQVVHDLEELHLSRNAPLRETSAQTNVFSAETNDGISPVRYEKLLTVMSKLLSSDSFANESGSCATELVVAAINGGLQQEEVFSSVEINGANA